MASDGPSGARPRLVCSTTPVALMTRRSEGRSSAASARCTRALDGAPIALPATNLLAHLLERPPDLRHDQRSRIASQERLEAVPAPRCTAGSSRNCCASLTNSDGTRACVCRRATDYTGKFGAWLSLVERLVRDQEAGGSNPLAPTTFLISPLVCTRGNCPRTFPFRPLPRRVFLPRFEFGWYRQSSPDVGRSSRAPAPRGFDAVNLQRVVSNR